MNLPYCTQKILEALRASGTKQADIIEYQLDHSQGKTCFALIGTHKECREAVGRLITYITFHCAGTHSVIQEAEEPVNLLLNWQQDSLGYESIYYWPELEWSAFYNVIAAAAELRRSRDD